jgi:hypothetical protein
MATSWRVHAGSCDGRSVTTEMVARVDCQVIAVASRKLWQRQEPVSNRSQHAVTVALLVCALPVCAAIWSIAVLINIIDLARGVE